MEDLGTTFGMQEDLERLERGGNFAMSPNQYFLLARCCLNAKVFGAYPVCIRPLPDRNGAEVDLFALGNQFQIQMRTDVDPSKITLSVIPIDSRKEVFTPIFEGFECEQTWSWLLRKIAEWERILYVDHWSALEAQNRASTD